MTSIPVRAARPQASTQAATAGIAVLAAVHVLTAAWMTLSPSTFFKQVGPFGTFNSHYVRDMAAMTGGVGLALAAALRWPMLRLGTVVAATTNALHMVNHWFDIGNAHDSSVMGVLSAVSESMLLAACLAVFVLLVRSGDR